MPIDPFDPGTSVAQEFPTQEPDTFRRLAQIIAAQKREMFDLRASVLANVSDIVADLKAQVAATAAATAAVAAAQITLTAQQATLTTAVANIATLVGQQTTGDAKTSDTGASAVTLGTSAVDYATVTFTVPTGFTRATVMGTTGIYWGGTGGVTAWVNISGSLGFLQNNSASFSNLFNSNAVNLTGLTGGGTFAVSSRVLAWSGTINAYIVTAATVTYFR